MNSPRVLCRLYPAEGLAQNVIVDTSSYHGIKNVLKMGPKDTTKTTIIYNRKTAAKDVYVIVTADDSAEFDPSSKVNNHAPRLFGNVLLRVVVSDFFEGRYRERGVDLTKLSSGEDVADALLAGWCAYMTEKERLWPKSDHTSPEDMAIVRSSCLHVQKQAMNLDIEAILQDVF